MKDQKMSEHLKDRLPPHSIEAEQGVLGCTLISPTECMMRLLQQFPGSEVFFDLRHRKLYDLLCVMHDGREPIDVITLHARLKSEGMVDAVGGLPYLASLPDKVPSASNLDYYLQIVFDKFKLRTLIQGCTEVIGRCYEDEETAVDRVEMLQRDLGQLAQLTNRKGSWSVKEALRGAIKDIESDIQTQGALTGLPTGFDEIDRKTRGLQNEDFIVIAARPSMGKSTLLMNMAEFQALQCHIPVGVFSLEMSKKSLMRRLISARSRIDLFNVANDLLAQETLDRIGKVSGQLALAPIFIDDTPALDDVQLRSRIRQMHHEHGIKIVYIDYLQLLRTRKRCDSRAQEVSQISNGLKHIARELNIPVVVAAQLNRESENQKGERPRISHLKDSGGIEQDADLIGLLYGTGEDDDTSARVPAALYIGKQRNGPRPTIRLQFQKDIFRFIMQSKIDDDDVPQDKKPKAAKPDPRFKDSV